MSTPTEVIKTWQIGQYGITTFYALWGTTDNYTDEIVVDLSGLNYTTTLQVLRLQIQTTSGITALVQYDASTDEILGASIGGTPFEHDYRKMGPGLETGVPNIGTGTTGDVTVTTTSAASGDEVFILVEWYAT